MHEFTTLRIAGSIRQTRDGNLYTPLQWVLVELPTDLDLEFYAEQASALR